MEDEGATGADESRTASVRQPGSDPSGNLRVLISPRNQFFKGQQSVSVPVDVTWCSNEIGTFALDQRYIKVNNVDATSDFSTSATGSFYSHPTLGLCEIYEVVSGTVTIGPGESVWVRADGYNYDYYAASDQVFFDRPIPQRAVEVIADGQSMEVLTGRPAQTTYRVRNLSEFAEPIGVSVSCVGAAFAGGCSLGAFDTSPLAPGATRTATVSYTAGAANATGTITLTGSVQRSSNAGAPGVAQTSVTIRGYRPAGIRIASKWNVLERDLCVALGAGPEAASECGDLRVTHALPSVRTLGRSKAPTLIYNSQHARPLPLIAAEVTPVASSGQLPTLVRARARVNGTLRDSADWIGSGWGVPGDTRRIVLPLTTAGLGAGYHVVTLEVRYRWPNNAWTQDTASTSVFVVDRRTSPFGAGWWLAGLEALQLLDANRLLWVGGDGSARIYTRDGLNPAVFRAPSVERPDSVSEVRTGGTLTGYTRWAPMRTQVQFNASGRHEATVNRLGHATRFRYAASNPSQLVRIVVPTATADTLTYTLEYGVTSGVLTRVLAPSPTLGGALRETLVKATGARVDSLRDPDGSWVRFGYGTGVAQYRIERRTDRRGYATLYAFDAGQRMSSHSRAVGGSTIAVAMRPAEVAGLAGSVAAPLDSVYARVDGPRTDVTDVSRIWTNDFGAPTRIRNALGFETTLTYGMSWPGLSVSSRNPDGLVSRVTYNARGLVDSMIVENPLGNGVNAVTTYLWHASWELPTRIATDSLVTEMAYDAATGNRLWQQTGGMGRRVTFAYNALGLPSTVDAPLTPPESLLYNRLGNVHRTRSPGGIIALSYGDAIGRDTLLVTPIADALARDSASVRNNGGWTRTIYDLSDRVLATTTWGPSVTVPSFGTPLRGTVPADSIRLEHEYDPEGNRTLTARIKREGQGAWRSETRWQYDAANRVTQHLTGSSTGWETYTLDPAGNVTQTTTPRSHVLTTEYDELGRVRRRMMPEVRYSVTSCHEYWGWGVNCWYQFPTRDSTPAIASDPSTRICIAADTSYFRYDAGGRITYASNNAARIARNYTRSGLLKTDELRIRTYYSGGGACEREPPAGQDGSVADAFAHHVYALSYSYDIVGRRDTLSYGLEKQVHRYFRTTGELKSVTDIRGNTFSFQYDSAGRPTTTSGPGSTWSRTVEYDPDSRVVGRTGKFINDVYTLDARGRVVHGRIGYLGELSGYDYDVDLWYGGLDALVVAQNLGNKGGTEEFGVDALGNRTWYRQFGSRPTHPNDDGQRYQTYNGYGQLLSVVSQGTLGYTFDQTLAYDASGNTVESHTGETNTEGGFDHDITRSYYGADQKLRIVNRHKGPGPVSEAGGVYEEYRYDPLGRRVLVRSRSTTSCGTPCPASYIERTLWDGDQVLMEFRAPGHDGASIWGDLEADGHSTTSAENYAFGSVAYTHAGGIDQPLSVIRYGIADQPSPIVVTPHDNWRGGYEAGTFLSACAVSGCPAIAWPAKQETVDMAPGSSSPAPGPWFGNLISRKTDGSGLQYSRNRYYDPQTGRFTQSDPIGLAGGANLYGFAGGDPVNFSDPFGLCPWCVGAAIGAVLGVAEGYAVAKLVGAEYSATDALTDAAMGAAGGALGGFLKAGRSVDRVVTVSRSRFPQAAAHIDDAQRAGKPQVLTLDRANAAARRKEALKGTKAQRGLDRDEYPPAMTREGGEGASVRHIDPSDNRGAGACVANQCRGLPEGARVRVETVPEE